MLNNWLPWTSTTKRPHTKFQQFPNIYREVPILANWVSLSSDTVPHCIKMSQSQTQTLSVNCPTTSVDKPQRHNWLCWYKQSIHVVLTASPTLIVPSWVTKFRAPTFPQWQNSMSFPHHFQGSPIFPGRIYWSLDFKNERPYLIRGLNLNPARKAKSADLSLNLQI